MATRQNRTGTAAKVPDLLTVEEAAAVLRIGRTKAYAMAREWRATGGRSGLPVKDFGNVLRVSRHALEELIGAPIEEVPTLDVEPGFVQPDMETLAKRATMPTPAHPPESRSEPPTVERSNARPRRQRSAAPRPTNQLALFELPPSA